MKKKLFFLPIILCCLVFLIVLTSCRPQTEPENSVLPLSYKSITEEEAKAALNKIQTSNQSDTKKAEQIITMLMEIKHEQIAYPDGHFFDFSFFWDPETEHADHLGYFTRATNGMELRTQSITQYYDLQHFNEVITDLDFREIDVKADSIKMDVYVAFKDAENLEGKRDVGKPFSFVGIEYFYSLCKRDGEWKITDIVYHSTFTEELLDENFSLEEFATNYIEKETQEYSEQT